MSQDSHGVDGALLTKEEFCARFKMEMLAMARRETFDDGSSIAEYADMTGPTYFDCQYMEDGLSPEDCAEADVSYWGEE